MTGRTLMILKENGIWNTVADLHLLYQTLLDMGFKPDDMSYEDLAQTCHNLVLANGSYIWEMFYVRMGHPYE
jgi:hypothetical protein